MWKWIKRQESAVQDIAKADALASKRQTDTVPGKAGEVPGEYLTLHHYLTNRYADIVLLTFDQIEGLLGFGLPECAWTQQEWWMGTDRDRDVRLATSARRTYWASSGLRVSCRSVLRASSRNCICDKLVLNASAVAATAAIVA